MSTAHDSELYEKLIKLTHVYLGPAADRFIARQIQNHLKKDPSDLTPQDLIKLTAWIQLTVSLLTDDNEVVEEYIQQVRHLAGAEPSAGEA